MSKFKVGDRVRIAKTDYESYELSIGKTGVVHDVGNMYTRILLDNQMQCEIGTLWNFKQSWLEKISTIIESKEDTAESQNKQILNYLQSGATINPISALELFGSFRLSARINDLRNDGHNIKTTMIYNGRNRWANYNLVTK